MFKKINKKKLIVLSFIIIICSILLFLIDKQEAIDTFVYERFIFNDALTSIFKGITIFGNATVIIIVLGLLLLYQKRKKQLKEGIYFTSFAVFSYLLSIILKFLFRRERPNIQQLIEITGFSFPSGHAYMSMIVYGYIIYLLGENTKGIIRTIFETLFVLLVVLIGISRIYLGVHYVTDILFGYSLGLLSLIIFIVYREKKQNN